MKGTRGDPYQVGQADPKVPYEPESDVGETVAWCDTCGDERRFERDTRDAAAEEERADEPDVRRAITGDEGWRCTVCGTFVPQLVSEEAYEYELSDVGYTKTQFKDEEDTIREREADGVTPPERATASSTPGLNEGQKRPEE